VNKTYLPDDRAYREIDSGKAAAFLRTLSPELVDSLRAAISPSNRATFDLFCHHPTHWILGMYHDPEIYTAPGNNGHSFISLPKDLYTHEDARNVIERFIAWNRWNRDT
jgi:hypothetical protein